ncbi:hypothetical protein TUN199_01304 [Pyrenophora tritici-repentis]|uniref:Uncharacterized protein n=1 Tax=Pyrenophora tritici-repentis TaxID=45151 RepID=A0A5M9KQQ5_9PLEO|nr:hypothetical protein PtrV1_13847 [Pyrenophora tritici-repentis]KAF7569460.1 hypothetical protein PtrM4_118750 [Pyrenophora tritici-repentis]KAI0586765.1 hypothetical protein Alg215_01803 [Pyrenophora tritici-repentis]KAI0626750.1 hypothetical protein TUN199_01304 [Pyrenophora tritici-repentis]
MADQALSGICALTAAGLFMSSLNVEDITISASDGQVKVEFDQEFLQTSRADGNAGAFGIMLEDLISRVPSPAMLQQNDGLNAFIGYTSQTTYLELQNVG